MLPCLIVDKSQEALVASNFSLRRGQIVELIADDPEDSVRCEVIWVAEQGHSRKGKRGCNRGQMSFARQLSPPFVIRAPIPNSPD